MATPSIDDMAVGLWAKVRTCAFIKPGMAVQIVFLDMIFVGVGVRTVFITLTLKLLVLFVFIRTYKDY